MFAGWRLLNNLKNSIKQLRPPYWRPDETYEGGGGQVKKTGGFPPQRYLITAGPGERRTGRVLLSFKMVIF